MFAFSKLNDLTKTLCLHLNPKAIQRHPTLFPPSTIALGLAQYLNLDAPINAQGI